MIINSIYDLNLNDSILLDFTVKMDEAIMHLDYIEDYEKMESSRRNLIFHSCNHILFKINTGYASPDSILSSEEFPFQNLRRFCFEMNTSASVIEIIAKSIELI